MKREYKKPMVVFEDFSLSANIAAGCEVKTHVPSNGICGYTPEGAAYAVFMTGISGCDRKYDTGLYNGICYHVPAENNNLFNS